jgi:hypothetical protein
MKHQIASAFEHRQRPAEVTSVGVNSTLRDDARHFEGMDWTKVTVDDWAKYSDAFYGFTPQAFAYYLPSLLVASLEKNAMPLIAADALIFVLDTSADPDLWNVWFSDRFRCLTSAELRTIRDWSAVRFTLVDNDLEAEYSRVRDTIEMLLLLTES